MPDQKLEIVKTESSQESQQWHTPVMTTYDMAETETGNSGNTDSGTLS